MSVRCAASRAWGQLVARTGPAAAAPAAFRLFSTPAAPEVRGAASAERQLAPRRCERGGSACCLGVRGGDADLRHARSPSAWSYFADIGISFSRSSKGTADARAGGGAPAAGGVQAAGA